VTLTERTREELAGPDHAAERARIRDGVLYALKAFLGVRLGLAVLAVLGLGLIPHDIQPVSVPGWPAPPFDHGFHDLCGSRPAAT